MKVIHLISSLEKGGAETQLVELVNQQIKNNIKIQICYLKGNPYWQKYLEKKKIECHYLDYQNIFNIIKLFRAVCLFLNITCKFQPDIIHSHLTPSEIVSFLSSFFIKNVKYITSKHVDSLILTGSRSNYANFFAKMLENIILKRTDKIICISRSVYKYFLKNTNIPKSKFCIIYYGINYHFYKKKYKKEIKLFYKKYKLSKNSYIIGNIARHVHQKNIYFLLKSFQLFINKYNNINAILILVGKGNLTNVLKKTAKKLNISKKIIWISFFENNAVLYKLFDIFCLTSNYEGLGMVLLESLSSRTPVIATKTSAIIEVIKNNKTGFLVEKNDHKKLSKLFFQLYKKKLLQITKNGLKLIETKFTSKKMSSGILKVYKNLLSNQRKK